MKPKLFTILCVASALFLALFIRCNQASSQQYIDSDTLIRKTVRMGKSFELRFDHCPGAGYTWQLQPGYDTTAIAITFISSEVREGNHPTGGHYILTNRYTALKKGSYTLVYRYCRPWEKEYAYECTIRLKVK